MSVSIVIPTRNRPTLLPEAVLSALTECPQDGSVIVVDDGSDVPASEVLSALGDGRLTILRQDPGRGAAAARNRGVAAARTDLVFFLDDDDVFLPGYVARVLAADPVQSSAAYGFSGSVLGRHDELRLLPLRAPLKRFVAGTGTGFWVRKLAFDRVGGFDETQRVDEDTDLCVRFAAEGSRPLVSRDAGTRVRRPDIAVTSTGAQLTLATAPDVKVSCYRRTYEKSGGRFRAVGPARWYLATRYIRCAVKAGFGQEAFDFAKVQCPWVFSIALRLYWLSKMRRQADRGAHQ